MLEIIKNIDTELFLFLNGIHSSWADFLFYWISNTFVWTPLYILVCALIIKRWKKQSIFILLFLILTVLCTDQTCNIIKKKVHRLRPSHDIELAEQVHLVEKPDGQLYRGGKFSFPSAHAANSCVLVFFFAFFVKARKKWPLWLMIIWSLALAYSRIYLGVHYPLDLLGGFFVGSFWSLALIFLWRNHPKMRGEWANRDIVTA